MNLHIPTPQRLTQDSTHDRLSVMRDEHRTLIALADGRDAARASQSAAALAVDELATCFRAGSLPNFARDWEMILEGLDHILLGDRDAGETSALVMLVENGVVVGASVGDTLAYVVSSDGDPRRLNTGSETEALLGSGIATATGFGPVSLHGRLITRRTERLGTRRGHPRTVAA